MPRPGDSVWQKMLLDLTALARARLRGLPLRGKNEEDIASSAIKSFFRGLERGQFKLPEDDRFSLWPLLSLIVARKCADLTAYLKAQKRDVARLTEADIEELVSRLPEPAAVLEHEEGRRQLLEALPEVRLRQIAEWKFEGYSNKEIAAKLDCVERSVERGLKLIREIWEKFVKANWEQPL